MIIETEGGGTGQGEGGEDGRRRGGQERVPPSHCRSLWFSLLLVSFTTVYMFITVIMSPYKATQRHWMKRVTADILIEKMAL